MEEIILLEDSEDAILYEYDLFNRLTKYQKGGTVVTYTYNGDGQRQSKTAGGVTTHFIWDGMNMIYEYTDTESASYIYGMTGILYRKLSTGETYTYTTNAHGDVVAYTDQSGNTQEYYYDAYGVAIKTYGVTDTGTITDNPFRYAGEYYDAESGFIYLRNRYYDPKQRRFITEDPIRDGSNWYVYCGNNPVKC